MTSKVSTAMSIGLGLLFAAPMPNAAIDSIHELALRHSSDLRLSAYATASSVQDLAKNASSREQALTVLHQLGITKIFLEVYRSGLVVNPRDLETVRDFLESNSFQVAGGIATVPGGDFGVRASTGLSWFNWQNAKTQTDLQAVVRSAAAVFDEFIVDDFLCTGDTSPESNIARANRSWADYRRDLLSSLSQSVFIGPAKEVNPAISMIIKYPQWYDRFHLFGYDVTREPQLFDKVWVGTETRGARTQRFGFTQPYQGFVNYRWLKSLAGSKMSGAWFDHGDCDAHDFVEQAWQTVLAGAQEIVLFNYANLVAGHPGHSLLKEDFARLADLAKAVRLHPVIGAAAYKPPHSDAGGDLYIMDFIGMLGIPLIPCSTFPEDSDTIFLPTQAAADPGIDTKLENALRRGKRIVVTTGFLATAPNSRKLTELAGLADLVQVAPMKADELMVGAERFSIKPALALEANVKPGRARVVLEALVQGRKVPFLLELETGGGQIAVLNTHTYSQADFDAVHEVLLPPRALGLTELPSQWGTQLRRVFGDAPGVHFRAPARITFQPLDNAGWFIQNYNDTPAVIQVELARRSSGRFFDGFTQEPLSAHSNVFSSVIPARSRLWLTPGTGP